MKILQGQSLENSAHECIAIDSDIQRLLRDTSVAIKIFQEGSYGRFTLERSFPLPNALQKALFWLCHSYGVARKEN